jgi:hypothetical protein
MCCWFSNTVYLDVRKEWAEMEREIILKEWLHPHWITSGPNPTVRIYIGPMGRDDSHRDCGRDSSASSGRVWQLDMV